MLNGEIATQIYSDNRYKSVCRGLAKKPHLAKDLHSEFILAVLEIKDNRLIDAKEGGYLEVFCIGIINSIWKNRNRVKSYVVGTTSPLFEFTSTLETTEDYFDAPEPNYNYKLDSFSKEVSKIISEDINSSDQDTMYNARVFYYSYNKQLPDVKEDNVKLKIEIDNPKQYAELSKIPYPTVIKSCNLVKEKLRKLFKSKIYD